MKSNILLALGCVLAVSSCGETSQSTAIGATPSAPGDTSRTELCGDALDNADGGDVLSELELQSSTVRRGGRISIGVPVDALAFELHVELVTANREILSTVRMRKATGEAGTLSSQLSIQRTAPLGSHDLELILPLEAGLFDSHNHVRYRRAAAEDLTYSREVVRNGALERVNLTCLLVAQLEITQ